MSKSNKGNMRLAKDKLLRAEYDQYLNIGEPDPTQNWLEMFTPAIITDLFTIMGSCSDNQQKSEYVQEELGLYGFEPLGLGTNVYAMWHPAYPGVAFKVALDTAGLADNYNDEVLYDLVNKILVDAGKRPRYTKCLIRHPTGIVSVQERKVLMKTQDRMDTFRGSILKMLQILAQHFLIVDMSPSLFQFNYGIDRDGNWCFIDASDLYPLENIKHLRCTKAIGSDRKNGGVLRCHGPLRYSEDFSAIVCTRCGKEYIPSEFRPNDKEEVSNMANVYADGLSPSEREALVSEEMGAIKRKMYGLLDKRPAQTTEIQMSESDQAILSSKMIEDEDERARFLTEHGVDPETIAALCPRVKQAAMHATGEEPEEGEEEDDSGDAEEKEPQAPPQPRRESIFYDPNRPKLNVTDRSGAVEVIQPGRVDGGPQRMGDVETTVPELPLDLIQKMSTSFTPKPTETDADPEEEDDGVEVIPSALGAANRTPDMSMTPSSDEEEEDESSDPKLTYKVFDSEGIDGIMICIPHGVDFDELYRTQGRGIYVTNDGGTTFAEAVDAGSLFKLIKQAYEDLEDDLGEDE